MLRKIKSHRWPSNPPNTSKALRLTAKTAPFLRTIKLYRKSEKNRKPFEKYATAFT